MRAMIFAAGIGSRLKPFTDLHPKALAPIGGSPILAIVINRLKKVGVREIVVNVHHFANQITDFLQANKNFGMDIQISDETHCILETGGGILKARNLLDDGKPFIVHNADILTNINLSHFSAAHRDDSIATLLVSERSTSRYILANPTSLRMKGWCNTSTSQVRPNGIVIDSQTKKYAFGGIHVISPTIFPLLEKYAMGLYGEQEHYKFSIMDFYIAACHSHIINVYPQAHNCQWHDIGKPQSWEAANASFEEKLYL